MNAELEKMVQEIAELHFPKGRDIDYSPWGARDLAKVAMRELAERVRRETLRDFRLRVAAVLLERAQEYFSNHGCNDMDGELIAEFGLSDGEKLEFSNAYRLANPDDDYAPAKPSDFDRLPDYAVMSLVAAELRRLAEK